MVHLHSLMSVMLQDSLETQGGKSVTFNVIINLEKNWGFQQFFNPLTPKSD